MKRYAACRPDGNVQFILQLPLGGQTPQDEFTYVELEDGFDPTGHRLEGQRLVPGVIDSRTLEEARARRWFDIKAAREAAINERTITTPMGVFDADEAAVANVLKALAGWREAQSLGIAPDAMTWTMADNSTRQITLTELGLLAVLLLQRGEQAHETARALRQQIEAATTTAELDAITWPA